MTVIRANGPSQSSLGRPRLASSGVGAAGGPPRRLSLPEKAGALLVAATLIELTTIILSPGYSPPPAAEPRILWNEMPPREGETRDNRSRFFNESAMMHRWLDGLSGLEIGASAHNGFGLNAVNVDYTADETVFTTEQKRMGGKYRRVDVIAPGNVLPHTTSSVDFVLSSHAIDYFYDPIGTVCEWLRVVKVGGYVAIIAPHKMRTFDKDRERTKLSELIRRRKEPIHPQDDDHRHWSVWIT